MEPERESGAVGGAASAWGSDETAAEWLTGEGRQADGARAVGADDAVGEWLTGPPARERYEPGVDEAEFLPALASIIPAVISAAPAIISAVQQLTSKPPAPSRLPPAPVPRPAPAPSPALPPPPSSAGAVPVPASSQPAPAAQPSLPPTPPPPAAVPPQPQPQPQPAPGSTGDILRQLAVLLPRLVDLVARPEGRESLTDAEPEPSWPPEPGGSTASADDDSPVAPPRRSDGNPAPLPDRSALNPGVSACPTSLLVARFGRPRDLVTEACQALTSPLWEGRMVTDQVGTVRVRGHRQAVALFQDAFAALEQADPELHARTSPSGMLCVRHVRGRPDVLSSHALGLALDVTLDGRVPVPVGGRVEQGLLTLHDVFSRFGIFWGAGLEPEDAAHFEVGADVVHRWMDEGVF
ncbi:hypothetical protein ABZ621_20985 [Streptomyces sp. NPDC007863]|uniref:hypothetical protein n=1 Tax=Streptomyces sp. NPDC007863 TaxID=3154894 RepID=UPI0033E0B2F6